jgi:hypothetical protein
MLFKTRTDKHCSFSWRLAHFTLDSVKVQFGSGNPNSLSVPIVSKLIVARSIHGYKVVYRVHRRLEQTESLQPHRVIQGNDV